MCRERITKPLDRVKLWEFAIKVLYSSTKLMSRHLLSSLNEHNPRRPADENIFVKSHAISDDSTNLTHRGRLTSMNK